MHKLRSGILSIGWLTAFGALLAFAASVTAADTPSTIGRIYSSAEIAEFKTLAKATVEALASGKQSEMVAKLTDLETAWDDKETVLRPRDEATWTLLDKTLDKAISDLRSSHTDLSKGNAALSDLLKLFDQATKP